MHSRWPTFACRILRYQTSITNTPNKLAILEEFCIKKYFPKWFDIKSNNSITDGLKNFFKLMQRNIRFPHKQVKDISMKVIQQNAFFPTKELLSLEYCY